MSTPIPNQPIDRTSRRTKIRMAQDNYYEAMRWVASAEKNLREAPEHTKTEHQEVLDSQKRWLAHCTNDLAKAKAKPQTDHRPMNIRPATPAQQDQIDAATRHLACALACAKKADSPRLAAKIRSAIKSAGGAERHLHHRMRRQEEPAKHTFASAGKEEHQP